MHHTSHESRRKERESPINKEKSIYADYVDGSPKTAEDMCATSVSANDVSMAWLEIIIHTQPADQLQYGTLDDEDTSSMFTAD